MKREKVRETVLAKSVFGSLISGGYTDDRLTDVRDWIDKMLAKVPEEYRDTARIDVDSVGGYEGEHHVEIEVYFARPETDEEYAARKAHAKAREAAQEQHERQTLAALQAKYEDR